MNEFLLVAHRGGSYYKPENSAAAFHLMRENGIRWVECDVRLTREELPVLIHDERLSVPDAGLCAVRDLTYQQLYELDIGGGERVMTLEALLADPESELNYDIEIKELDAVEKVVNLVEKYKLVKRVILTSFNPEALQVIKDMRPEIRRGLLVDRLFGRLIRGKNVIRAAVMLGCNYFLPHFHRLTHQEVEAAHHEGLLVIPWTVNSKEDAQRMLEMGVNGLISDRPDYLVEICRNQRG